MVAAVGAEFGQPLTARAGLSAGDVATGVLGTNQLAFGIWGDPPGVAVTLDSLARPSQVLADRNVADQLGQEWDIGPAEELPGLADDIEAHAIRGAIAGSEPNAPAETRGEVVAPGAVTRVRTAENKKEPSRFRMTVPESCSVMV